MSLKPVRTAITLAPGRPRRPGFRLRLTARLALALVLAATSCAAGRAGPAPDPEAVREATRPDPPARYASARAFSHYLRARSAEADGDYRTAAEELQLALAHDPGSSQLHLALAQALARLAQVGRAEEEAHRAVEADPDGAAAADAHLLLGRIYASQRKNAAAIEEARASIRTEVALAEEARKEGEDVAPDPEPWRVLGELYLESGDEQAAARTFEDLATRVPGEADGLREMGRYYLEKRDLDRAEKYLRRAVERAPGDAEAWRKLAQLGLARKRPGEARQAYEELLKRDGDDLEALLGLGKIALAAGDRSAARAWFGQLLQVAPDAVDARLRVAFSWLEARHPEEAQRTAEDGLRSDGSDPRLHFVLGLALQDRKRWGEAAQSFATVPSTEAELYASARMNLAYCLSQIGKHAEAEKAIEPALRARPRDVRLVTMLAYVLERGGRTAEAVNLLQRALGERKGDPEGLEGTAELREALASSLAKLGRFKEGIEVLRRGLEVKPRDETLLYALGVAYEKAGDHEAAVAQMKALLVVSPDHADALNFIGYSWADAGVRLDEAERMVSKALDLKPDNAFFMDSLGWVYFKQGDFAKAIPILEKADALSGAEPTILEHLGDAYRSSRRLGDAEKTYRRALRAFEQGIEGERPGQRAAVEKKLRDLGAEMRPAKR